MASLDKRESLIRAADALFHRNGLEGTSIADIAMDAEVPLGNVYYYFKTRGDLVKAVTEHRLSALQARRVELDSLPSPRARLIAYVNGFEDSTASVTAHGCPVGSLCVEANKQGGMAAFNASAVFRDSLEWMRAQFLAMGFPDQEARAHAARILGGRQGSIILANTFREPEYIRQEIARLLQWLGGLSAKNEKQGGKRIETRKEIGNGKKSGNKSGKEKERKKT